MNTLKRPILAEGTGVNRKTLERVKFVIPESMSLKGIEALRQNVSVETLAKPDGKPITFDEVIRSRLRQWVPPSGEFALVDVPTLARTQLIFNTIIGLELSEDRLLAAITELDRADPNVRDTLTLVAEKNAIPAVRAAAKKALE
ncbi:MAG: hypothetical protein PHF60_04935 [Candidatus ainarchaeum sp.]|nr:hypothetical protein [Candidatus ainarchaeum sp.]